MAEPAADSNLSRRQVIARGAVVAGVAWTAPMLMATQAAAAHVSCPAARICGSGATAVCCPNNTTCQLVGGVPTCLRDGSLGGSCGNLGQGICDSPFKCNGNVNQCNNCATPNICGGEGAQCCGEDECVDEFICTDQGAAAGLKMFCRKTCAGTANGVQGPCNTGQQCNEGLCAEPCTTNATCLGTAICNAGFCGFQVDGGVTCP